MVRFLGLVTLIGRNFNDDTLILGILITGVTLITEMCENSPDTLNHFKKVIFSIIFQSVQFLFNDGIQTKLAKK